MEEAEVEGERFMFTREYPARCSGKFDMIYMRRNKKNVRA
jgi:hypothetical protein